MVRKKINIYYSEWVWNPLPQMNMKTYVDMKVAVAINKNIDFS